MTFRPLSEAFIRRSWYAQFFRFIAIMPRHTRYYASLIFWDNVNDGNDDNDGDDDDDNDELKYHCRCPTCRTVGEFQQNEEVDAAVATLPVACPYSDDFGTECSWTGQLHQFSTHRHVFDVFDVFDIFCEQPQVSTNNRRRRDDDDEDDVQGPPLKLRCLIDSSIHVHTDVIVEHPDTGSPAAEGPAVDTARPTEHRP